MLPLRIVAFVGLLSLAGCIEMPSADRQLQLATLEFHSGCLYVTRPAYSKAHSDCVLALYEERQQEIGRLREKVMPPPPPQSETWVPASSFSSEPGPRDYLP
jgi:hypothetical protein